MSALTAEKPNPQFAYVLPKLTQGEKTIWGYMKEFAKHIPGVRILDDKMSISFNFNDGYGIRSVQVLGIGTDGKGEGLKGTYFDGLVLDEMQEQTQEAWEGVLLPTLGGGRNGWVVLTGTAGLGYWEEIWQKEKNNPDSTFKQFDLRASQTNRVGTNSPEETKEELRIAKSQMSREMYEQYYENNPHAPSRGSYYGPVIYQLSQNGQANPDVAKYDPSKKVFVSFDIGFVDETVAIFYQYYDDKYQIIDYKYWTSTLYPDILKDIMAEPYQISHFLVPHDAKNVTGASVEGSFIDIVRKNCPYVEIIRAANPGQAGGKELNYDKARDILTRCVINTQKCERLLHALSLFGRKWNDKTRTTSTTPQQSWAQHSADSFQTFAMLYHKVPVTMLNTGPNFRSAPKNQIFTKNRPNR